MKKTRTKTALISVFHKEGIEDFAKQLVDMGWIILSSGGTAEYLEKHGIEVTDIATMVGKPILGGRVKTLSREIHAGLLSKDTAEDRQELTNEGITWIDLVCCDMYPLQEEIAKPDSTRESVIEKTDIGGPTMLSSAAKARRIVICDPADRALVIERLRARTIDEEYLDFLAAKADYIVGQYRIAGAVYHGKGKYSATAGELVAECKYGENARQTPAGLYSPGSTHPLALSKLEQIAGVTPSYNNYCDIDRMLKTITYLAALYDSHNMKIPYIALAVKHGNPCGASVGGNITEVLQKMVMGDPRAIFGGSVITNFAINENEAETLLSYGVEKGRRIVDCIVAPEFSDDAVDTLKRKKDKCRFLKNDALMNLDAGSLDTNPLRRQTFGGEFLQQPNYSPVPGLLNHDELKKYGTATALQQVDMLLAAAICATSNSNTITLVKNRQLIGNGTGQQDRVGAAQLAILKAKQSGHDIKGAVVCSDSFFPFPDGPEYLIDAGVSVILTTSGSIKDQETIDLCEKKGTVLYMIPDKIGRGFFGH